jgi:hypothetical protein
MRKKIKTTEKEKNCNKKNNLKKDPITQRINSSSTNLKAKIN